jgi:hypothetical protein
MISEFLSTAPRRGKRRATPRTPEPWERNVLRLIAECFAVRVDQLGRLLGYEEVRAERLTTHLAKAGYVSSGPVICGEPDWVWLTAAGTRLSGVDFAPWRPRMGGMERIRAVIEIRLHIAEREPKARWVSSRTIAREQGRNGHRPHGVVEVGGERHAIFALLGVINPDLWVSILETSMVRYDAVIAFAKRRPRTTLERLAAERRWSKLVLRPIPESE